MNSKRVITISKHANALLITITLFYVFIQYPHMMQKSIPIASQWDFCTSESYSYAQNNKHFVLYGIVTFYLQYVNYCALNVIASESAMVL